MQAARGERDAGQDYGEAALFNGIDGNHSFTLDAKHTFPAGKVVPVCSNTARMLDSTRLKSLFSVLSSPVRVHFGIFEGCGKKLPYNQRPGKAGGSDDDDSCSGGGCGGCC